jgi:hypothetical protein
MQCPFEPDQTHHRTPDHDGLPAHIRVGRVTQSWIIAVASISTRAEGGVRALTWTSVLTGRI